MRVITGWADEHRWVLLLLAQAQRHPDNEMTNEQLMRFYEKHGFKRQTEYVREIRMIRHPSQEIHDL